ncbi:chemosensory pili system protein ChpE/L-lysine exporter family protein LysE/ArgO [Variovorax boronicumulans]|uniref:LysE family translocator n=1 Tax=Variovorax boronicumulans TaxID=436515 RepID=UPI002784FA5A|nr:LysE family transporter [Variovorax boronicumulans]MDP9913018.1 chemosensory pili system protein ChpE/L-lysine exporter family protein LysE/ArgO [Variovorax boronicumulans]
MLSLAISAFFLGLVFNAAPGAVFAETVRQGMQGGFRPAFAVQIGSLVGDALWAVLGLAGAGMLMQIDALRWPLGIAGVLYLLWLATDSWRAAKRDTTIDGSQPAPAGRALRSGVVLSVTNPQNLAYWAALGSAMAGLGMNEPTASQYTVFFAGFMTASVFWCFLCAGVVAKLFGRAGQRWTHITHRMCAIAFVALALASMRDLLNFTGPAEPRPATSPAKQGTTWQP